MDYDPAKAESALTVLLSREEQERVSMSELKSLLDRSLGRTRRALDACLLLYAMTITISLALLLAYGLLQGTSAHGRWAVGDHPPHGNTFPAGEDYLSHVSAAALALAAKLSTLDSPGDSDSGPVARQKRDQPCEKPSSTGQPSTAPGTGNVASAVVHHHWYRGKKVGSMSMAKPAANVIGIVKYINNSFGEPESILTWSSRQPLSYLREAGLDASRQKLLVRQAGIYYAFGQVSFYDPRLLYDGLLLKVNGRAAALSIVPNALVWSEQLNGTGVRLTRRRSSLGFAHADASQMPSPQLESDQKYEFRKTVAVSALVSLQVNDKLELVPACSMDADRSRKTSNGKPRRCTPVLYRQGGKAAPTNYFSMFMI